MTMTQPRSLLDRFHLSLVEQIRSSHPEYLRSSFTVAEIYQNLVPYRTHRDSIGVEMNGDYEDALLRLLSGEGNYLVLESEPARKRIQAELKSSNPNTTIYREFAAAGVRLNPALIPQEGEGGAAPAPTARVEVGLDDSPPPQEAPGAVNPELGLFVADLFGDPGASAAAGPPVSPPRDAVAPTPAEPAPPPEPTSPPRVHDLPQAPPTASPAVPPAPTRLTAPLTATGDDAPRPAVPAPGPGSSMTPVPAPEPVRETTTTSLGDPLRAALEEENTRLRRIVADQALEIQRLRERLDRL